MAVVVPEATAAIAVETGSGGGKRAMPDQEHAADAGATSVEYALMASLIAMAIVTAVTGLGTAVIAIFSNFVSQMGW
jgi:Flp pilus assembly pilin Flp